MPTSSALFGVDGTQLPDPLPVLPDPLTGPQRSSWPDTPQISPVPSPPMPDGRQMRAAIAAVLDEDPTAPVGAAVRFPPAVPQRYAVGTRPAPHRPQVPAPRSTAPSRVFKPLSPSTDLRRRIGRDSARGLQNRSSAGVRTGCIIALIIFGVVAFNIIAGIVQSVSGLFS